MQFKKVSLGILLILNACSEVPTTEVHVYWLDSLEKRLVRKQDGEYIAIDQAGDFFCMRPEDLEKLMKRGRLWN